MLGTGIVAGTANAYFVSGKPASVSRDSSVSNINAEDASSKACLSRVIFVAADVRCVENMD